MIDNIQKEINGVAYPPTHTYDYKTMEPTSILAQRVNIITTNFPNFFKGKRLLDVGSNKGFFSLKYAKNFKEVVGIDLDSSGINICKKIQKKNTKFYHSGFGTFHADNIEFDKIFIANTAHHICKEVNGWDWVHKLGAMSTDEVLLEMPVGMDCADMKTVFTEEQQKFFTEENFIKAVEQYFDIMAIIPTVSYTPNRFFILLKRKKDATHNKYYKKDLSTIRYLKNNCTNVVLVKNNIINGEQVYKELSPFNDKLGLLLASSFPTNTKITGFVYDENEKLLGHVEDYNTSSLYPYFENEQEIFKLHCKENIFLTKFDYYNTDPATINYFKDPTIGFDKSLVLQSNRITETTFESYKKLFDNSYTKIDIGNVHQIQQAIKTKDCKKLHEAFTKAYNNIR